MPLPILRTKLHRPPTEATHLHREHLLNRLVQSRHRPLTLVSAPAGYGKSTLVSCWLESCNVPSAWVSLDENDNDLRLFITYLVSAFQQISPAACAETLSILRANTLPPVPVIAGTLLNELDQTENAFILVLDDYHLIRDKSVHELVAKLLEHPSTIMHLVLIARRDPPLPLVALRARQQMVEIRTRDLRFSLRETLVFLRQTLGAPVDGAVAAFLAEKTEGWVIGLYLAALSMRNQAEPARTLANLPTENRYIMDYVVSEILSQLPPTVQESMLKISVLNRFCAPLCEAVYRSEADAADGGPKGRDFLELLENNNLLIIALDDEREWFRFHHLFQALLKRQLKQQHNAEKIAQLHIRASAWFAENGFIEEALAHAHESGDIESAAALIKRHRHDIINNRQQWHQLNVWLKHFPPDFIQQNTDLLLAKAWAYQRQELHSELFATLARIEGDKSTIDPRFSDDGLPWGEFQALKSLQYYMTARGERSVSAAREALNHLPAKYQGARGFAVMILSAALQMQGDNVQSRGVVMEALQQEAASTYVLKSMLLAALCYTNWIAADLNSLQPAADQLLKHGQEHDLPETVAAARFFIGARHYLRNELDLSEDTLAPILGHQVIPNISIYCQNIFILSLTYQAKGRTREANQIIESMIAYVLENYNTDLLELCQALRGDLALRQGHVAETDFWAQTHPSTPLYPVYHYYIPQLNMPKVLLARRTAPSLTEAEALLSRMVDYYASIHSTRVLIDILILLAMVNAAQGNESAALEKLAEALTLAEPGGFIRPFLDQGSQLADLIDRLYQQSSNLPYARHIRDAFASAQSQAPNDRSARSNQPRSALPDAPMIEPLSNREIDVLKKLAKGMSNHKIAESLFISPETVKRHLSTIYRKLAVENRHQAIASAKSIGIL